MNYKEKLLYVREFVYDNVDNVEEFCVLFDITLEDVINAFPDKLVSHYEQVAVEPPNESDEEAEAWGGYSIVSPEEERGVGREGESDEA